MAITEALCDSVASAVGTRVRGRCIDICTFSSIECGTSGGVSFAGTLGCLLSSAIMSALSIVFNVTTIKTAAVVFICSILGCFFDSYLGSQHQAKNKCSICGEMTEDAVHCGQATQLHKGKKALNNNAVNLLSNVFATILTFVLWYFIDDPLGQRIVCYTILFWCAFLCSGLIHEFGHILGCLLSLCKILSIKYAFVEFDFANKRVSLTSAKRNYCKFYATNSKKRFFVMLSGPLLNIISVIILCLVPGFYRHIFLILLALCNLYKSIYNMLPMEDSDGAILVKLFKERKR